MSSKCHLHLIPFVEIDGLWQKVSSMRKYMLKRMVSNVMWSEARSQKVRHVCVCRAPMFLMGSIFVDWKWLCVGSQIHALSLVAKVVSIVIESERISQRGNLSLPFSLSLTSSPFRRMYVRERMSKGRKKWWYPSILIDQPKLFGVIDCILDRNQLNTLFIQTNWLTTMYSISFMKLKTFATSHKTKQTFIGHNISIFSIVFE